MKRLLFLSALCGVLGSTSVFALGLSDFLDPGHVTALLNGERPVLVQTRNPQPQLAPRHQVLRGHIEAIQRDLGPNVLVETLFLYTKPPFAAQGAWSAAEFAALYNATLALSTLAGIKYFSESRQAMWVLYEVSTVIDSPAARNPLPDPFFLRPRPELTIFARQKDLTFGDNIYQYDFFTAPGALIFIQQNLSPLSLGPIPAIGRNRLRSVVAVLDAGEYILIYAASMARVATLMGMSNRIGSSFINRADAILNWFSAQADGAFAAANRP